MVSGDNGESGSISAHSLFEDGVWKPNDRESIQLTDNPWHVIYCHSTSDVTHTHSPVKTLSDVLLQKVPTMPRPHLEKGGRGITGIQAAPEYQRIQQY